MYGEEWLFLPVHGVWGKKINREMERESGVSSALHMGFSRCSARAGRVLKFSAAVRAGKNQERPGITGDGVFFL